MIWAKVIGLDKANTSGGSDWVSPKNLKHRESKLGCQKTEKKQHCHRRGPLYQFNTEFSAHEQSRISSIQYISVSKMNQLCDKL